MEGKTKAIGYVRSKDSYNLDDQTNIIKQYCDSKGYDLKEVLSDAGVFGDSIDERPNLTKTMQYIKDGKAKYLIVTKLSRLSRKVSNVASILSVLKSNNAYLAVVEQGMDTATDSIIDDGILLALGFIQAERDKE